MASAGVAFSGVDGFNRAVVARPTIMAGDARPHVVAEETAFPGDLVDGVGNGGDGGFSEALDEGIGGPLGLGRLEAERADSAHNRTEQESIFSGRHRRVR